jgi:hypothetical protein
VTKAWESRLNIALSELLNQAGVGSRPEQMGEGRRDVLIYHQGVTFVLEGSYDRADAEKDARRRIEQLSADIAIAIHYPSTFPQNLTESAIRQRLLSTELPVRIILPEDISGTLWEILHKKEVLAAPAGDWFEVDLNRLSSLILEVAQLIIDETLLTDVERSVEQLVEKVVYNFVGQKQSDRIAENVYEVLYKLYGFSIGDPKEIKEALFAQATLAVLLGTVYYESIREMYGLDSIRALSKRHGAKQGIEEAVRKILEINYELIFDLVRQLLLTLPALERIFKELVDLAAEISTKRALLRRDLGGKVYHKVVGTWALRKGLATFYTQVPSAYLLLYLAQPKMGKVADFACGSGTLLVAAYSALNSQHRLELWKKGEDKAPEEIERIFHKKFINNCYAFDVLSYALQITILNLALHSPETPIDKMLPSQVIPLGYKKNEKDNFVSLGSLELGRAQPRWNKFISEDVKQMGVRGSKMVSLSQIAESGPFDLIVMNPPFSRTTGRGGKEGGGLFGFITNKDERSLIKRDYDSLSNEFRSNLIQTALKLLKSNPLKIVLKDDEFKLYRQIWQAGEGLLFLYLADIQIAKNGKICFVLPRGLLSGVSWFLARTLLASHFHIEYIIVSYDSNEYNFSESTSLSECMFIARKKKRHEESEVTKFVMLLKKPSTSIEAIALADAITKGDDSYFEAGKARTLVRPIGRKALIDNCDNWGRFVFLPELEILDQIDHLLGGKIRIGGKECDVPMTKLNEIISTIGVDRKRFADTFRPLTEFVPGAFPMVKGGEELQRLCMAISPNAYALPLNQQGREMFSVKGGTFFVPDRIWIPTAHVTALLSDAKALANIFYSVRLKQESPERNKALCVWLNTTWGIITILANRQDTRGGFITMKMSQWRMLPVPNLDKLRPGQIRALSDIFDKYKHRNLARIPDQYSPSSLPDKTRYEIDKAFLSVFGVDASDTDLARLYGPLGQAIEQWVGE